MGHEHLVPARADLLRLAYERRGMIRTRYGKLSIKRRRLVWKAQCKASTLQNNYVPGAELQGAEFPPRTRPMHGLAPIA